MTYQICRQKDRHGEQCPPYACLEIPCYAIHGVEREERGQSDLGNEHMKQKDDKEVGGQ